MAEAKLRAAGFTGRILTPSSAEFEPALRRANTGSERKAALIVYPASNEDVSKAVTWATRAHLKIAVKCGGHHYSSANSVEDGAVIDMGALKNISIDNKNNRVIIGGGCLWGEVYTALRDENLVCVGGGVHVVGVGGHLTGGGYGPLSFKYGMACDNVLELTVVVASGQVLKASETENSNLFFAVRGGSSSFGVVTQFVLRTYPPQGPYFFRSLGFYADARDGIFSALRNFLKNVPTERGILGFLNFVRGSPPQNEARTTVNLPSRSHPLTLAVQPSLIMNFFGLGAVDDFEDTFVPFSNVAKPFLDHTTVCPSLVEFSHVIDDLLLLGSPRKANGGAPITNLHPGMPEEIWDRWMLYTDANPDARDTKIFLEFHMSKRQKPETTCIPIFVDQHGMCVSSEEHRDAAGDKRAEAWTNEISNCARFYEKKFGGRDLGVNGNASMLLERSEDVWGVNYPRLRKIKAQYDPRGVFNRYFPIEPDFSASASL